MDRATNEDDGNARLSIKLAERLTFAILSQRLSPGRLIGVETDLTQRYGVSRATLREAIRQLESRGVARMRRGAGGGLVVQGTPVSIAAGTLATYYELSSITLAQLICARSELEAMAAGMAAGRVTDLQIAQLRADVAGWQGVEDPIKLRDMHFALREAIARSSGNDMLWLATSAFLRVTAELSALLTGNRDAVRDYAKRQREQKLALVEAIAAGDMAGAATMVREEGQYFLASEVFAPFLNATLPDLVLGSGETAGIHRPIAEKLGLRTALKLRRDIVQQGLEQGANIGTEEQFCDRYKVSRSLGREALMLLETYGVVNIRRGREGGIVVGRPDPAAAIEAVSGHMRFMSLTDADMRNTVATIDIDSIGRAAARFAGSDLAGPFAGTGNYLALVSHLYPPRDQHSGELICEIVRACEPNAGQPGGPCHEGHWHALRIALEVGDASLARRHMRGLWGRLDDA